MFHSALNSGELHPHGEVLQVPACYQLHVQGVWLPRQDLADKQGVLPQASMCSSLFVLEVWWEACNGFSNVVVFLQ